MEPSTTLQQILQWVRDGGLLGASVFLFYGGFKKWWVWGYQADELRMLVIEAKRERDDMRRERDEWRDYALKSTTMAKQSVSALEHVTRPSATTTA